MKKKALSIYLQAIPVLFIYDKLNLYGLNSLLLAGGVSLQKTPYKTERNPFPAPALRKLIAIFSLRSSVASRNDSQVILKSLLPSDLVSRYCHEFHHQYHGKWLLKNAKGGQRRAAKISLTYKTGLLILHHAKRKFLSKKLHGWPDL